MTVWSEIILIIIQYLLIDFCRAELGEFRWEGHSGNIQMEAMIRMNSNEIVPKSHRSSSKSLCHRFRRALTPQGWETPGYLRETFSLLFCFWIELYSVSRKQLTVDFTPDSNMELLWRVTQDNCPARFGEISGGRVSTSGTAAAAGAPGPSTPAGTEDSRWCRATWGRAPGKLAVLGRQRGLKSLQEEVSLS